MKQKLLNYSFLLFVVLLIQSCSKDNSFQSLSRGAVISVEEVGSLTKAQIVERAEEFSAVGIALYDVKFYSVDYRTVYMDKPTKSRGLLIIPNGVDSLQLVCYTHGTLFPLNIKLVNNNLPSNYRGQNEFFTEARNICLPLASSGFAVFMPDYVGFTNSKNNEHPYVYYAELFNGILDGIRAAKNVLKDKNYPDDKRVFLAGWSQGAGAAISAHKFIEQNYSSEFTVVASSGLAGPYNFSKFMNFVFDNRKDAFEYLNIYSWGVYTLNKFSSMKRPTDQLFSYPVYDQMSSILVPSKIPEKVLNNYFLNRITSGADQEMIQLIKQNSFHEGWTPIGKVFLHHGDADDIVPYFNSVDANAGLTAAGGDVTFYSYPGGKHDTEVGNYASKTINDFNILK
jgi:fermentation-respiration switch protein FrsA (DUF1100 family)